MSLIVSMYLVAITVAAIQISTSVLAAPLLGSTSSLLALSLLNDPAPNTPPPRNLTVPRKLHLPSDPNFYRIPHSDEQLKLYSYSPTVLPRLATIIVLETAKRDIAFNIKARTEFDTLPIHYEWGDVHLVLHGTQAMTWEVMGTMVKGLQRWMEEWEFVGCDFDMGQIGLDNLFGTGAVVAFERTVQ